MFVFIRLSIQIIEGGGGGSCFRSGKRQVLCTFPSFESPFLEFQNEKTHTVTRVEKLSLSIKTKIQQIGTVSVSNVVTNSIISYFINCRWWDFYCYTFMTNYLSLKKQTFYRIRYKMEECKSPPLITKRGNFYIS